MQEELDYLIKANEAYKPAMDALHELNDSMLISQDDYRKDTGNLTCLLKEVQNAVELAKFIKRHPEDSNARKAVERFSTVPEEYYKFLEEVRKGYKGFAEVMAGSPEEVDHELQAMMDNIPKAYEVAIHQLEEIAKEFKETK